MCTLTYVPLGEDSFVFTDNRDESPERTTENLSQSADGHLLFPREPQAGGTWICVDKRDGRFGCLLNGAFERHKHQPPYRRSRGLVVLDFFEYADAQAFFEQYYLEGIEPFTFVVMDGKGQLYDFRWDGQQRHLKTLNPHQPYIWSSATLYTKEIAGLRQEWFDVWLQQHPQPRREDILDFHHKAGNGDEENSLVMRRYGGKLCTISMSSVLYKKNEIDFHYKDLINGHLANEHISR